MKKILLLSILLTAATSFAQDKDKVEYNVAYIHCACRDMDSNSQLRLDSETDIDALIKSLEVRSLWSSMR